MPANTQFSIAVHLMAGLGYGGAGEVTSTMLAGSVNTSPSFVRRTLAKLSKAELVNTTMGKHGSCSLAKDPGEISLLDIYRAVDAPKAFAIHDYAEQKACPVSCKIRSAMDNVLARTQTSFEAGLSAMTLADVIGDMKEG
jgi:Rrf2 family protein